MTTSDPSTELHALIQQNFRAVERKDLQAILNFFADDAVFADPHYPNPVMRGRAEIEDGLRWALGGMRSFSFTVGRFWGAPDGHSAAVEVATHHVLNTGMHLRFSQAFVVESSAGKITRMQAYEPYGPNGMGGLVLGLTRLFRRLRRRSPPQTTVAPRT